MGKSRRNRGNGHQRADPIAKPVKPPTDPELAALREKSILPVVKDLRSADPKARTAAAGAIANILHDSRCRKLLLREQIVHIVLTETVTDSSLESRAAGWEILKLLTQEEEADFCVHLYRLDILTAIEHAAKKVIESLKTPSISDFNKASKAEQKFFWVIAEALATIITGLAEAQDEMFEATVQNETIIELLFVLVSCDLAAPDVITSALSCIMTLSEDNRQFVERILGDEQTRCFKHLMTFKSADGLRAALACGVLHNIFSAMQWDDLNPGRENSSDATLVTPLTNALETFNPKNELISSSGGASPVEILQVALEVLASIGTTLQESLSKGSKQEAAWNGFGDNEDTAMDVEDNDDGSNQEHEVEDDEMNQDEIEADMEMVTAPDDYPDEASGIDDMPTLSILIQKAIPQVVRISRTEGQDEASSLIRGHALTVLNNVAWTVSCIDFSEGRSATILAAWAPAARLIWREAIVPILSSDTSDVSVATSVSSIAWAIVRTLHERTPLSGTEHKRFMSLYQASKSLPLEKDDPFQGTGVKCIGVLGQLALDPAPIELNRDIGVFLLTVLAALPETPAADAVEALNQLFEIYGEEKHACDIEVFWQNGFLKHFEDAAPKVKAMAKKIDKRTATELRLRADEAALNLTRFIQYKQKHRPGQENVEISIRHGKQP